MTSPVNGGPQSPPPPVRMSGAGDSFGELVPSRGQRTLGLALLLALQAVVGIVLGSLGTLVVLALNGLL